MYRCTWTDWIRDYYFTIFKRFRFHASTQKRLRCVFKSFHYIHRFQKVAFSVSVFVRYVWTEGESAKKTLHFQTNPYTCGRGLNFRRCKKTLKKCQSVQTLRPPTKHLPAPERKRFNVKFAKRSQV